MDGTSLGLGVVAAVLQTYTAVTGAYDFYIQVKEFPATYREIRIGLLIERYRLEQWGNHVLSEPKQKQAQNSSHDESLWNLFGFVLNSMFIAFQESSQTMGNYGQLAGVPQQDSFSDSELLESMQITAKSPPKHTLKSITRTAKFVLWEKSKMQQLIRKLCSWNDSLDKMTSPLVQTASRRRLRTNFSTGDPQQLKDLEAAAKLLNHRDLERMATARRAIEEGFSSDTLGPSSEHDSIAKPSDTPPKYRLEMKELDFGRSISFMTEQTRVMATLQGESVLVDWCGCLDDTWRRKNPTAFRQRTESLITILNSDLRPLDLGTILHCVGYLDNNSNVTGYVFRLPSDAQPGQGPMTLHQLLKRVKQGSDVPDLGERFELAKALVSTVFAIHNLGWMHKNIQPKHILFWPKSHNKDELNLSKPYLVGFDISRPNQPGEFSEKPNPNPGDLYRHPSYKGVNSESFLPSFDMYSLGVILYEIGLWRRVTFQKPRRSRTRPSLETHHSDQNYIEKVVMSGPIMELKRFMGVRYCDAVTTCLDRNLDAIWASGEGDRLRRYQNEVQAKIVDLIALCNA